jgi:two-component system response regulator HupR/HoxA
VNAIDPLEDLHLVRKLRDVVRRFWGLELGFADRRGHVSSHDQGVAVPPPNAYCRASLRQSEGFQRCNRSVEEATTLLQAETKIGEGARPRGPYGRVGMTRIVQPCHLGFPVLMSPVADATRFYGALFTGGFRRAGVDDELRRTVERGSRLLRLAVDDPKSAWEDMPVLGEPELERLSFLMDEAAEEILTLLRGSTEPTRFGDLIGSSDRMRQLYVMLERVAKSDTTVLIIGENGTGKEVIARAIHEKGPRRGKAFIATNCGALAENLLESELFGHEKGAFTGAIRDKPGLFLAADKGTLFLDEVGDTSPAMQVKLLRVLQEGTFTPVGATRPVTVDVRVIAATNRPLAKMVEEGSFREDLYYRLNVIGLDVPPLRERKSDLRALVDHFLAALDARTPSGRPKRLSGEVVQYFYEYDWPGNVRQLENEIERLVVLSGDSEEIGPSFLSPAILKAVKAPISADTPARGTLAEALQHAERQVIAAGLVRTGWNRSRLARELDMSRTTLIKKIAEYRIEEGKRR